MRLPQHCSMQAAVGPMPAAVQRVHGLRKHPTHRAWMGRVRSRLAVVMRAQPPHDDLDTGADGRSLADRLRMASLRPLQLATILPGHHPAGKEMKIC